MTRRVVLLAFALPLFLSPSPQGCRSEPRAGGGLTRAEFANLIRDTSEAGGYFWSNNYISNETSYLHVLGVLTRLGIRGGAYIGVGPNQNFTYVAAIRPRIAFVVDIRRDNLLEHLLFKVLMEKAETRQQYLSFLTGRPIHGPPLSEEGSIEELVASIERSEPDHGFFQAQLRHVRETLRSWADLGLSPTDLNDVERIYGEFFRQGLDIKYDSWRSFFFPTLKEFMLETDLEGKHGNWLVSEERFRYVRDMQRANLIVPIVGDFAGDHALRQLAAVVAMRGETVSAIYVSNVEFYLFRQRKWDRFVANVRKLSIDDRTVIIRAYANLHRPHPQMTRNHITVSLVQNVRRFLMNADRGLYRNLWDVVTIDQEK